MTVHPAFNVADVSTWPMTLNVAEVAAIYRRTVGGEGAVERMKIAAPAPSAPHVPLKRGPGRPPNQAA